MKDNTVRIAVFVSGSGTNLQALIDAEKSGLLKSGHIALVLSSKDGVYALARAKENGIPAFAVTRNQWRKKEAVEAEMLRLLDDYAIDLIVLAGYLSILSEDFVKKYDHRILNIHPSLIPAFCGEGFYGLRVHEEVLRRGVKITGATVHFVNEIPDGGEIILQKAVSVCEKDTPERLQLRVMRQAEWKILPIATEKIAKRLLKKENLYDYL